MNKIFRSIINHPSGIQLEILPRENRLSKAVERCIDNKAIAGSYRWEVHELTIMGESKKIVSGGSPSLEPLHREFDRLVKEFPHG